MLKEIKHLPRKVAEHLLQWFSQHLLTIVCCILIVGLGVVFLVWSSPGTTTIGENISTGNLEVSGNATTTGNLQVSGLTNLATTTLWGNLDLNNNSINNVLSVGNDDWEASNPDMAVAYLIFREEDDAGNFKAYKVKDGETGKIVKTVTDEYKAQQAFQYAHDNAPEGAVIFIKPAGKARYYVDGKTQITRNVHFMSYPRHGCIIKPKAGAGVSSIFEVNRTTSGCLPFTGMRLEGNNESTHGIHVINLQNPLRLFHMYLVKFGGYEIYNESSEPVIVHSGRISTIKATTNASVTLLGEVEPQGNIDVRRVIRLSPVEAPLAIVHLSSDQAITAGSWETVTFDTEDIIQNISFSTSTGKFTVTEGGWYKLGAIVRIDGATAGDTLSVEISRNGVQQIRTNTTAEGTSRESLYLSTIVLAYPGDTLEVQVKDANNAATVVGVKADTQFWLHKLQGF